MREFNNKRDWCTQKLQSKTLPELQAELNLGQAIELRAQTAASIKTKLFLSDSLI